MSRKCKDWLATYEEYVADTESPRIFHRWVGLSLVSSVLRKKVRFALGRLSIYPNTYVVLVGPPGTRKSVAINFGQNLLNELPDIRISSDATTPEAFIQDLEAAETTTILSDGAAFKHCSMSIFSRELEIFLGNRMSNMKMLAILTDVFDSPEADWSYRVKHGRSNAIPSVFVNMLAAITPESIANVLPISAVGSGFTSRIMFIYADRMGKKVPIPEAPKLSEALVEDLYAMSRIAGVYQFSPEGRKFWETWYYAYDEHSIERKCQEPAFTYWYERKPTHILKVAQLVAATYSDKLFITPEHIKRSIRLVEATEIKMGNSFSAVGKSIITAEVDLILNIVKKAGRISEPALMFRVIKDVDAKTFDNVITTAIRSGNIRFVAGSPVYYEWIGQD